MTKYNSVKVKSCNLQIYKLKLGTKNASEFSLKSSSNMTGNSDDVTNFLHKLLRTDRQVSRIPKAFANIS